MFLNTAELLLLVYYCCVTTAELLLLVYCFTALLLLRYYCSYLFIPPVFHYLFAELVHLLGVLGTQETSCFVVAGLHERDIFDLFLPEFDKPWVIHLRENLLLCASYLPLGVAQRTCEIHAIKLFFWRRCRGGKVKGTHTPDVGYQAIFRHRKYSKLFPLDPAIASFCFLFTLVRHNGKQQKYERSL